MFSITINNQTVTVEEGKTILRIADELGIAIPRFCYHPNLSIAGNCRMCLVEIEGMPKLATACSTYPTDGMIIHTESDRVKKARENVLQLLLINHPLDCPICDQGGECDLQDVFMKYGKHDSPFKEEKRKLKPVALSEYVMFYPERCIHCMRCVRFAKEIAGIEEIGAVGRGENTRITTALEGVIHSELSVNIVDLCPVGALTERPFQYKARCWELTKTDAINMGDGFGTPISIHSKDNTILRIKPKNGWITDAARFSHLIINDNRLTTPMVRKNGTLEEVSWEEALQTAAAKLKQGHASAMVGGTTSCEAAQALKILFDSVPKSALECRVKSEKIDTKQPANYRFNASVEEIEAADCILLIGTDLRNEAPLINLRVRQNVETGNTKVITVGTPHELLYKTKHLGTNYKILRDLVLGKHPICDALLSAKHPLLIIGMDAVQRDNGADIVHDAKMLAETYMKPKHGVGEAIANQIRHVLHRETKTKPETNSFNMLHTTPNIVGLLDMGLVTDSGTLDKAKTIYAINSEVPVSNTAFIIYQGAYNTATAQRADIILPATNYVEEQGSYVNTQGIKQLSNKVVEPVPTIRENWKIVHELTLGLGKNPTYTSFRQLQKMLEPVL